MVERLTVIGLFSLLIAVVTLWGLHTTPQKGSLALLEHMCFGLMICYIGSFLLTPLGIDIPTTPLASLVTGYLGLAGGVAMTFVSLLP